MNWFRELLLRWRRYRYKRSEVAERLHRKYLVNGEMVTDRDKQELAQRVLDAERRLHLLQVEADVLSAAQQRRAAKPKESQSK